MQNDELLHITKTIPRRPGVYHFHGDESHILYVGKALSLRDRLASYAQDDTPKTQELVAHASRISWIETGSDFEALLLEANLIKKYRPRYNVVFRDDKSYLYIFISTGEEYPKVFLTRQPKNFANKIDPGQARMTNVARKTKYEYLEDLKGIYFGPFPSSGTARSVLKFLRRIIPFCQQKSLGKRACFYSHIGLCNPCPSTIIKQPLQVAETMKKQYRANLMRLKRILEGDSTAVKQDLVKEMKVYADNEEFEVAAQIRSQIQKLDYITSGAAPKTRGFLENPNFYFDRQKAALAELRQILSHEGITTDDLHKIECFDISNFAGTLSVASQVVLVDGVPEKGLYRRYRIKIDGKPNDFAMLAEAVGRRLSHEDWEYPALFVIDGGRGQVSSVKQVLEARRIQIPVIGIAKQFERLIIPVGTAFKEIALPRKSLALQLVQQIRDEAHRFALAYHRKRRNNFGLV